MRQITIALAGNPNVGKSTLFNALTGSRQHVGNWPGKTVEKKEGQLDLGDQTISVVDLPGTYSLTAYSIEEIIARDFVVNERPTAVVAVVDASNLERNLYLVAQLIELDSPVIIALNMTDIASRRGLLISPERLSERLGGIPVVETVGNRSRGIELLVEAISMVVEQPHTGRIQTSFQGILGGEHQALEEAVKAHPVGEHVRAGWLATKLLEDDPIVLDDLTSRGGDDLIRLAEEAQGRIEAETGEDAEILIADQRYQFIGEVIDSVLVRRSDKLVSRSDKLDNLITHRIWGLPIFFVMMWVVFQFTANVSAPLLDWVDGFFNEFLYDWSRTLFEVWGLGGSWLQSLISDGIISGVGGVLVFVPVLLFLYFALALLEDSGYMARAAFVMDRVMRWMGLHGKSFLPMIVGFGCTVPAVYATRTLADDKNRKLTAFLATFMSCGARLPVYVVFGAAFFGTASGNLVLGMYLLGIIVALGTGLVLKETIYKSRPPAPFVMELPPYRLPRPKDVWRQMWERTRGFLIKSGTVILGVSAVLWLLMAIPAGPGNGGFNEVKQADSLFGTVSGWIAPVFKPAGFGSWQASGSLITGFLAKEVVIGTMNQIYADEGPGAFEPRPPFREDLARTGLDFGKACLLTIQELVNILPRTVNLIPGVGVPELAFFPDLDVEQDNTRLEGSLLDAYAKTAGSAQAGPIAAVAFNVFVLLYIPCVSAVSAMRHEFGPRWMWAQIGYTLVLAWAAAVITFQAGKLFLL